MHHPTTRVLTVLELLQSHSKLSGPELAERLEVNPRTVRNYITLLQDLGVPVEAERGRHGPYRLRPGFKLPPLMFTEDEAVALTLGLFTARRLGLGGSGAATEGALAKVERVLPINIKERVQAVQDSLVFDLTSPYNAPASPLVATLSLATQARRQVLLCHRTREGEDT